MISLATFANILAVHPFVDEATVLFIKSYQYISPAYRKACLKITRARTTPDNPLLSVNVPSTQFVQLIKGPIPEFAQLLDWTAIRNTLTAFANFDFTNSLISSFIRSVPFSATVNEELERESFLESFFKELAATQGEDRPQELDYRCWFYEEHRDLPLFPGGPIRSLQNDGVRRVFEEFRSSFVDKVIYPRASKRHMSKETAHEMGYSSVTGQEYLRFYHRTGHTPAGRMEMRQVWRFNDLTPRTYFAQGGRLFIKSMYAQEIFNTLVDMFEVSHRRRRFDLSRLAYDEEDDIWIYDYSSFTSNCTEQKYFIDALAEFCRGTAIKVFDVHDGIQILDLGEYLREYNTTCNMNPEFYLGGGILKLGIAEQDFIHKRAGALGIYGNLASCTVLHGLLSMYISGSVKRSSVVGDDGLIVVQPVRGWTLEDGQISFKAPDFIRNSLRKLGEINDSKFAVLRHPNSPYESQWTYLKRALTRHDNHLELWDQEHIINLFQVLGICRRPTSRDGPEDDVQSVKSLCVQITSLLLRVYRQQNTLSEEELQILFYLLTATYETLRLPKWGSIQGANIRFERKNDAGHKIGVEYVFVQGPIPAIPTSIDAIMMFRRDPIETLGRSHNFGEDPLELPMVKHRSEIRRDLPPLISGNEVLTGGSRSLKMLVTLGYADRDVATETVRSYDEYMEFRRRIMDRQYEIVYLYTIVRDVPLRLVNALAIQS